MFWVHSAGCKRRDVPTWQVAPPHTTLNASEQFENILKHASLSIGVNLSGPERKFPQTADFHGRLFFTEIIIEFQQTTNICNFKIGKNLILHYNMLSTELSNTTVLKGRMRHWLYWHKIGGRSLPLPKKRQKVFEIGSALCFIYEH